MDLDILYKYFLDSNGVSTDTRTLKPGQIFFALKGMNFDGNAHAQKALSQGAKLCVIDDPSYQKNTHDYLVVNDVLTTLQHLATHHRLHSKAKIIAITGSNGKTTTKELLAAVLARK